MGEKKLFFMMSDKDEFRYSLYAVGDPERDRDPHDESIEEQGQALLRMERSKYTDFMNFTSIGSRIYMVGGASSDEKEGKIFPSNKVFIYDINSSTSAPVSGPDMNSPQIFPYLLTYETKLFALSYLLYPPDYKGTVHCAPAFEVLDVENIDSGWSTLPLPLPVLRFSARKNVYKITAFTAVSGFIFISVKDAGTYAFDITNRVWDYVSDEALPFLHQAHTMPQDSSLCCGYSLSSSRFCAFRICYDSTSSQGFQVVETGINLPDYLFPMKPPLESCRPCQTVLNPSGELYFVLTGVDKDMSYNTLTRNRYIKVSALEFTYPKTVDVASKPSLRRCRKKKKKRKIEHSIVQLSGKWKMCYYGGVVCDELEHVIASFAM